MCDPMYLAIAATVVASTSAVMGFEGQQQVAKSNAAMANEQAAQTYNSLGERGAQIDAQQSENTVSAVIDRAQQEGAISAYAGSFGLGGATTTRMTNAADASIGRTLGIQDLNSQSQRLGIHDETLGTDLQRQAKIASVPQADPLNLALGIAKAGLSGATIYTGTGGKFGDNGASAAATTTGGSRMVGSFDSGLA